MALKRNRSLFRQGANAVGSAVTHAIANRLAKAVKTGFQTSGGWQRPPGMPGTVGAHSTGDNTMSFTNMGDRGNAHVTFRRTRMKKSRKQLRALGKRRRTVRKFKRKVRKVIRSKQAISCLLEDTPLPMIFSNTTGGVFASDLIGANQIVIGNAGIWGIHTGELAGAGNFEGTLINKEINDYRLRINIADSTEPADAWNFTTHWTALKYLEITVENRYNLQDLVFDLYEFVAAADISDINYANPAITWKRVVDMNQGTSTGTATVGQRRGMQPFDWPYFGRYWKLVKKTKVRIPSDADEARFPYQTFRMMGRKRFIDGKILQENYAIKGLTKYFMMVVEPDLVSNHYLVAPTDISYIWFRRITHYKPLNQDGFHAPNAPNTIYATVTAPSS